MSPESVICISIEWLKKGETHIKLFLRHSIFFLFVKLSNHLLIVINNGAMIDDIKYRFSEFDWSVNHGVVKLVKTRKRAIINRWSWSSAKINAKRDRRDRWFRFVITEDYLHIFVNLSSYLMSSYFSLLTCFFFLLPTYSACVG